MSFSAASVTVVGEGGVASVCVELTSVAAGLQREVVVSINTQTGTAGESAMKTLYCQSQLPPTPVDLELSCQKSV